MNKHNLLFCMIISIMSFVLGFGVKGALDIQAVTPVQIESPGWKKIADDWKQAAKGWEDASKKWQAVSERWEGIATKCVYDK